MILISVQTVLGSIGDLSIQSNTINESAYVESSLFFGGNMTDEAKGGTIDSQNNNIITGYTASSDFLVTDNNHHGGIEGFISKFDVNNTLVWSKYIGGSEFDAINGIVTDSEDNIIVTGSTTSEDLSVKNGFDEIYDGNGDIFITKYHPNGSQLWSTYYGGDLLETNSKVAIDEDDNLIIIGTTFSTDLIAGFSECDLSSSSNIFVTKWSPIGNLIWTRMICGNGMDNAMAVSIDNTGNILLAGYSTSSIFQDTYVFDQQDKLNDIMIASIDFIGLINWIQLLGGSENEFGRAIVTDEWGNVYVTGFTSSTDLSTYNDEKLIYNGLEDIIVVKLSSLGVPDWIKIIGSNATDHACGIAINNQNNIIIMAATKSNNFPMVNAINSTYGGGWDGLLLQLNSGGELAFSTYFGGSNNDLGSSILISGEFVHLFGYTSSENLPTKGVDSTFGGVTDAFYAKFYIPSVENPITTVSSTSTMTSSDQISSSSTLQTYPISSTSSTSDSNIDVISRIGFLVVIAIIAFRRYFSNRFSTLK
ncbi:MAG: hypothetical protein GPJ54_07875 [Candidatus Heimdallarchaeota archaeon]|nr:hypothetical protein [Candidatus Heimdallarchaeota archaeon]